MHYPHIYIDPIKHLLTKQAYTSTVFGWVFLGFVLGLFFFLVNLHLPCYWSWNQHGFPCSMCKLCSLYRNIYMLSYALTRKPEMASISSHIDTRIETRLESINYIIVWLSLCQPNKSDSALTVFTRCLPFRVISSFPTGPNDQLGSWKH